MTFSVADTPPPPVRAVSPGVGHLLLVRALQSGPLSARADPGDPRIARE